MSDSKPKRRLDLWVLGGVLIFGLVFIVAATIIGRKERPEHTITPREPLPAAERRWAEGLSTWEPILPRPIGEPGDARAIVKAHDAVVAELRGTLPIDEGKNRLVPLSTQPGKELQPEERATLLANLALCSLMLGEVRNAEAALEEPVILRPEDPQIRFLHGLICERLGNERDAAAAYDLVIAAKPRHADALYRRARIAHGAGRPRAARAWLDDCLEVARAWPDAQRLMGRVAWDMADPSRARRAWLDVLQLIPGDPEADAWAKRIDGSRRP